MHNLLKKRLATLGICISLAASFAEPAAATNIRFEQLALEGREYNYAVMTLAMIRIGMANGSLNSAELRIICKLANKAMAENEIGARCGSPIVREAIEHARSNNLPIEEVAGLIQTPAEAQDVYASALNIFNRDGSRATLEQLNALERALINRTELEFDALDAQILRDNS